jgi:hypothetical protein
MQSSSSERKLNYESQSHHKKASDHTGSKSIKNELPKSGKKELLPKKDLFSEHILPTEDDVSFGMEMQGGARGLLKHRDPLTKDPLARDPLARNSLSRGRDRVEREKPSLAARRGLPPVR